MALVRRRLPLRRSRLLRIRIGDARLGLATLPAGSADVVVRDVFYGGVAPGRFRTVEFAAQVRETLAPGGTYLLNIADATPFRLLGGDLATLAGVFPQLVVVYEPAVLRGRRHGNFVVVASAAQLPVADITRRVADGAVLGRVRSGAQALALAGDHRVLRDADLTQ